ncbi:MAG: hypothetical protein WCJ14_15315 [Verrucomicrobiota bacterium]
MPRVWLAGLIWCLAVSGLAVAESWLVAWKEQPFHSDASAKVFVADRMEDKGPITWFYKGSQKKGFAKNEFYRCLSLEPGVPAELTNPEQLASLKFNFEKLSGFAKQYPNSSEILHPQLVAMRAMLDNYQAGKAYFAGRWLPQAECEALISQRDAAIRTAAAGRQLLAHQRAEILEFRRRDTSAHQRMESRKLAYATLGGIAIYLVFLIGGMARGLRKLVWLLLLVPCLVAGWLTYQQGGCAWVPAFQKYLQLLPEHLKDPADIPPP